MSYKSFYGERLPDKYFREHTNYRKIVCNVLVRRLRRYLNKTWAADALPILKRKPCLPTCLPFRIVHIDGPQGLDSCTLSFDMEINKCNQAIGLSLMNMIQISSHFRSRDPRLPKIHKHHECSDKGVIPIFYNILKRK